METSFWRRQGQGSSGGRLRFEQEQKCPSGTGGKQIGRVNAHRFGGTLQRGGWLLLKESGR